jgi:hypothetical protein
MPTGPFGLSYLLGLLSEYEYNAGLFDLKSKSILEKYLHQLEDRLQFISSENLSLILHKGFSGKKVDILLANACYMQSIETNFFFRTIARNVIAPQTSFPFLGYDYSSLFSLLENNPGVSIRSVSENIVRSFTSKYAREPYKSILKNYYQLDEEYPINKVSFSAIDLDHFDKSFFAVLNSFANIMYKGGELDNPNLEDTRVECKNLTEFDNDGLNLLIDLTFFLETYTRINNTTEARSNLQKYKKMLAKKRLRIGYLNRKSNTSHPGFLSFMMIPVGGVVVRKKPLYRLMISHAYNNSAFKEELLSWTDFLNAWNLKKL